MKTEHRSGSAGARWKLVAALVMLAAGSFYFFGYRPEAEQSVSLESDHEEKRLFLQKTQEIVEARRADLAAENASADAAKREAAVPDEPDREGILLDLEQAAKSSGVRIQEVVFEETGISEPSADPAETAPMDNPGLLSEADFNLAGFTGMSFRLNLQGALAEVKSFAAALHKDERLYVVQSFEYGNDEATGTKTAVLQLLAFYR